MIDAETNLEYAGRYGEVHAEVPPNDNYWIEIDVTFCIKMPSKYYLVHFLVDGFDLGFTEPVVGTTNNWSGQKLIGDSKNYPLCTKPCICLIRDVTNTGNKDVELHGATAVIFVLMKR